VILGGALQFVLAVLLLKVPVFQNSLAVLNDAVSGLTNATRAGTSFVFGYLGGAELPFDRPRRAPIRF
jgi:CNT family concentrative nucleoside transporter